MARDLVILQCTETKERHYTTTKNKVNTQSLELRKYNKKLKKHVLYREKK